MSAKLIWAIIFTIFTIIFCVKTYLANEKYNVMAVYGVLAIISVFTAIFLGIAAINDYRIKEMESCVQAGYKIYANGVPVDGTKLDLAHYNYSIDEELEEMYLTSN